MTVRYLHWQDKHSEILWSRTSLIGLFNRYKNDAIRMSSGGGVLYPAENPSDGDAKLLVYPPGYSLLIAVVTKVSANPYPILWIIQSVCDAFTAVVVFLIAAEMFKQAAGFIAALLVALSPHFAFYSLVLSPDTLPVLPVLIALWLIVRGIKRPHAVLFVTAGVLIGLSCWLRANALWLAPILAIVTLFLLDRKRLLYCSLIISGTVVAIAPITIRNALVFRSFIPLTLQTGLSLAEGIGDYDREGKFGMPTSDRESRQKDAEWFGRPDYAESLWKPDGIVRDRYRAARAIEVIRSNPGWFLGVMTKRAAYMLSYNDTRTVAFPENTKNIPPITTEAPFAHDFVAAPRKEAASEQPVAVLNGAVLDGLPVIPDGSTPVWQATGSDLMTTAAMISSEATASPYGDSLKLDSDLSGYSDQASMARIPVQRYTDHVLSIAVSLYKGDVAVKVTDSRRRISLALASVRAASAADRIPQREADHVEGRAQSQQDRFVLLLPFSSGDRDSVELVLSNNNQDPTRSSILVGEASLYAVGPAAGRRAGALRWVLRSVQRNLFVTGRLLPLVLLGAAFLLAGKYHRELSLLLAIPFYYVASHSIIHTEYRYILGAHYVLFILAGIAIFVAAKLLAAAIRSGFAAARSLRKS
ncbi:MAG TPA: glycosyltransferase family 39 protein [Blastocatellia bacterium]|nr:glycosyltransferase family 39 protein [Blastocatellia bacterium]